MPFSDFSREVTFKDDTYRAADLYELERQGMARIGTLPFAARVILENLMRHLDSGYVEKRHIESCAAYYSGESDQANVLVPFFPSRILMQDFTGVPAIVDLAAMRDAMAAAGRSPGVINPVVPVDLVVDHSVQVDFYRRRDACRLNVEKEYERNEERYRLLKWAQSSFDNLRVVPPGSGICHQVNLESLGNVVAVTSREGERIACPETLIGTDSHTTMINSLGILGWGVGGIEAEAVMLGQPYYMNLPEIVEVRLTGRPAEGVKATDIVLTVTEVLRNEGVVEKIVEFTGPGLEALSLPDRATIANMSPEYGATSGFFPVDFQSIAYLDRTNRAGAFVEFYCRETGFFATGRENIRYSKVIDIDLSKVVRSIAGPSRPQDRIALDNVGARSSGRDEKGDREENGNLTHGSIVIAAITSCTNTSNPHLMMGAGIAARNAAAKGLEVPSHVKTSLSPGSKVVIDYLEAADLLGSLEAIGFHNTGFGCMTCIGNSGPLDDETAEDIRSGDLNVASVLSGNRNFEARIHQLVKSNYLMSPILVVLFALAGRIDIDFAKEPVGIGKHGRPVFYEELWPDSEEIDACVAQYVQNDFFQQEYDRIFRGDDLWRRLETLGSQTYSWDENSLYIRRPPFFDRFHPGAVSAANRDIKGARVLLSVGDSVTTDHISPAGEIPAAYPAGDYLSAGGVEKEAFNTYGARRGNHEVMMRGTFANIRIRNRLVDGPGGYTIVLPENEETFIYTAAQEYKKRGVPLVVLAGEEYGTGSSRDWAAKGTSLLGVKAVIASSFERIHRSNLVGMGVIPLVFMGNQTPDSLGIEGNELFEIKGVVDMRPGSILEVRAYKRSGEMIRFQVTSRLDTDMEIAYYRHGGVLPYVLSRFLRGSHYLT